MGDFSTYRERVKIYGELAAKADNEERYEEAVENYIKAIELFAFMMKCKSTVSRTNNKNNF